MKLSKKDTIYLSIWWVCIFPFVLHFCGVITLLASSLSIMFSAMVLFLGLIVNFTMVIRRIDVIFLCVNIVFLILNVIANGDWGVVINFLNLYCLLLLVKNVVFPREWVRKIRTVLTILLAILLLSFRVVWQYSSLFVYNNDTEINANTYGLLWLVLCFNTILRIELAEISIKRKKIMYVITVLAAMGVIWMSGCRTAFLALLFFSALCFWKKFNYKAMVFLMIVVGIVFPFIYVYMSKTTANIQIMGKYVFSGRQGVWEAVWMNLQSAPFLGVGSEALVDWEREKIFSSAHNSYLGYWVTIGVVPMLTFIAYLFMLGNKIANNYLSARMFLASLFICIFETLYNDANFSFLFLLLMMINEKKYIAEE